MCAQPVDPETRRRIAQAFGEDQPRLRRFARVAAALMALTAAGFVISVVVRVNLPGYGGDAVPLDFTAFWAAAKLALAGEPYAAFDQARLEAAMSLPPGVQGGGYLWLYPPAWYLAIIPFGLLPYSVAFVLFSVIAFGAFAAATRPVAAPLPGGLPLVLAAPSVVLILKFGNNSLLWTAGLVAALWALRRGREAQAGLFIALLTLKPQLGLVIPFALLAEARWRVIFWATGGALAIGAASTAVMGVDYWALWLDSMRYKSALIEAGALRTQAMLTWYAFGRFIGMTNDGGFALQLVAMLGAAGTVAWVWRRTVTADLKAATLCIAILVATPYAWHNEMSLALVGAVFLARDGFGRTVGARIWLVALWLGQVPGLAVMSYLPPAAYVPPLLTATLGLCLWRATDAREPNAVRAGRGEADTAPGSVAEGTPRG